MLRCNKGRLLLFARFALFTSQANRFAADKISIPEQVVNTDGAPANGQIGNAQTQNLIGFLLYVLLGAGC